MKESIKSLDRFVTGIVMIIISIVILAVPIATDGSYFTMFSENSLYISELEHASLIMILLFTGAGSMLVLTSLGMLYDKTVFNVIGVIICSTTLAISSILIFISPEVYSLNYNFSFWTILLALLSLAGFGDAFLFKKYY